MTEERTTMSAIQPSVVSTSTKEFSPFQLLPHGLNEISIVGCDGELTSQPLPYLRPRFEVSSSDNAISSQALRSAQAEL
jgi:hypothetical protein